MNAKAKNIIYSLVVLALLAVVWFIRKPTQKLHEISGATMGTTYQVKYFGSESVDPAEVDQTLKDLNQSLSTYIEDSEISRFNRGELMKMQSPYFLPVLEKSKEVYKETEGAFDPTVMPLVRAWGFGPGEKAIPDSSQVSELLSLVSFDSIFFNEEALCKMKKEMQLDFSAIAKGYGVDVVYDLLSSKGLENIYVEIGGELRTSGTNDKGTAWKIGIEDPQSEMNESKIFNIIQLTDQSMATSGNYRNYYIKDGVRYAHTISPYTGYPVEHSLLSATVLSKDCMTADAYATAFMVLGVDKAKKILEAHPELEAYLIFGSEDGKLETFKTQGIKLLRDGA